MKLSRVTRFIRVNLVGCLAFLNLIVIYKKFSVERPAPVACKCSASHSVTNKSGVVSLPLPIASAGSPALPPAPVRHDVRGGWEGELREATCDYTSGTWTDGGPCLNVGNGRYFRRGDQTSWGRIMWIGPDYFTTDKFLVRLVNPESRDFGKIELAGGQM